MVALRGRDAVDVAGLLRELAIVRLDGPPVLDILAEQLQPLLRTESAMACSWRCEDTGASVDGFSLAGRGAGAAHDLQAGMDAWVRRASGAWAHYDPRHTEPAQRNAVIGVGTWRSLAESRVPALIAKMPVSPEERERRTQSIHEAEPWFARWSMKDAEQLRVLICDGPTLLAWVGAFQNAPFDARAMRILHSLVPGMQRRLAIEARIASAASSPLVPALLDELAAAAYVLDVAGKVVAANALGHRALSGDRKLRERLVVARKRGGDAGFAAVDLTERGVPRYALLITRGVDAPPDGVVALLAERYRLTPREAQVTTHLARGRTNRSIAATLDCSERTVETHVARVLAKTDCASRSVLLAALWSLASRR